MTKPGPKDPNWQQKEITARGRRLVLGAVAAAYPNWVVYKSHASKIQASYWFEQGKVERVRDTYFNCWRYRWVPDTEPS